MNTFDEYDAIRNLVDCYVAAAREADSGLMKSVFHEDAAMYCVQEGKITGGSVKTLFDNIDKRPRSENVQAVITGIGITGDFAQVSVETDNWNGRRFSDKFLLLKAVDGWKIITKIFHNHSA